MTIRIFRATVDLVATNSREPAIANMMIPILKVMVALAQVADQMCDHRPKAAAIMRTPAANGLSSEHPKALAEMMIRTSAVTVVSADNDKT